MKKTRGVKKTEEYFSKIAPARITLVVLLFFFSSGGFAAPPIICPDTKTAPSSVTEAYSLARAYDKGECGVKKDKARARELYLNAAQKGQVLAQYALGEIYFIGDGVAVDYPAAKKWYLAAAQQGHGLSQLRLAFLYAENHFKGLTVDYKEAEKWFLKAAEQDAGDARFRLGNFYHNYKRPPDMQKAVLWLTRAAEGGHRVAMFDLARLTDDKEQALKWMTKAADLGLLTAQMTLANMHAPENPALALHYYDRAAAQGNMQALVRAGEMYLKGRGAAPNPEKGRKYLQKAVAKGSDEARIILEGDKR